MVVQMKSPKVGVRLSECCGAAILLLVLVTSCGMPGPAAETAASSHSLVGTKAPEFDLAAEGGGAALSPGAHTGQVVIVDFWATWCAPCKESFPFYQALSDKHPGQLVVLGVSVDEEPGGISDFVRETSVKFPVGWDEGQSVARLYKPEKMPTSYLVDRNGVVQYVHAGFGSSDPQSIEQHVEQLLK